MRKLAVFMIFIGVLFTGCQSKVVPKGPWVQKIDSWELSRMVINYSTQMKTEKHLDLEDSYAAYEDDIKKIVLRYSSQRLLTLYEARLLIVELVDGFLDRLNFNSFVSTDLDHFPFTPNDLDVRINFESYYGKYCDEQYIGLIWLQDGCVYYYAFDRKDLRVDWDHDRLEPYFKSRELALIKREADIPFLEEKALKETESVDGYRSFTP